MNYEQANNVKELASRVNSVLEGLEIECPRCKGMDIKKLKVITTCPLCDDLGKLHYSWTPQVGEWCYEDRLGELYLINWNMLDDIKDDDSFRNALTPILEWEEIERVLEKAGIEFNWFYPATGVEIEMWWVEDNPNQDPCVIKKLTGNESRQEAVMEVVLALGKELR